MVTQLRDIFRGFRLHEATDDALVNIVYGSKCDAKDSVLVPLVAHHGTKLVDQFLAPCVPRAVQLYPMGVNLILPARLHARPMGAYLILPAHLHVRPMGRTCG